MATLLCPRSLNPINRICTAFSSELKCKGYMRSPDKRQPAVAVRCIETVLTTRWIKQHSLIWKPNVQISFELNGLCGTSFETTTSIRPMARDALTKHFH